MLSKRTMLSKQSLAVALSRLAPFAEAETRLEQYPSDSDLAATLLWHAHMHGRIDGKRVLDLGAGTGILAIGAALLGAATVVAVEKDERALAVLRRNLGMYEGTTQVRAVQGDAAACTEAADVVVMNPPFGTRERHADRAFLTAATRLAPVIYTIHKTTTERFVEAFCRDNGFRVTWRERHGFPLKRTMPHHRKRLARIDVTLFCLEAQMKSP